MTLDEEIDKIIEVVGKHTSVKDPLAHIRDDAHKVSRSIVMYVVRVGYPHLLKRFARRINRTIECVCQYSRYIDDLAQNNEALKNTIYKIAADLNCNALFSNRARRRKKDRHNIVSNTMTLFGFDYTSRDITDRYNAIRSAASWFEHTYQNM